MNYFELFLSPAERAFATGDLAKLGEKAIPILESLFNGCAKNEYGVPYNKIGALGCGFVTIKFLGTLAKPLEKYVRKGIDDSHPYAIEAAGYLGELEQETVRALARALVREPASEASASLVRCGQSDNPEVIEIIKSNPVSVSVLEKIKIYLSKNA